MSDTQPPATVSIPRVVLLGASNLTRSISTAVETAQLVCGPQLEMLVAAGHGRSYGLKGLFLGRTLPSILNCGLWEALAARPDAPTTAVITDIGNDILFNVSVPQIADWVETVLDRLENTHARVCMTLLPVASASAVSPRRYRFFRRLYVPGCRLELSEAVDRTQELSSRLEQIGKARNVRLVEQPGAWYGFDPIHIRLRCWREVWREIFFPWAEATAAHSKSIHGSLPRWIYLRTRRPQQRTWCGIEQRATQPACLLRDGTTISFF
jgi:hypothetical protein